MDNGKVPTLSEHFLMPENGLIVVNIVVRKFIFRLIAYVISGK
jgi:hypothetical protein